MIREHTVSISYGREVLWCRSLQLLDALRLTQVFFTSTISMCVFPYPNHKSKDSGYHVLYTPWPPLRWTCDFVLYNGNWPPNMFKQGWFSTVSHCSLVRTNYSRFKTLLKSMNCAPNEVIRSLMWEQYNIMLCWAK